LQWNDAYAETIYTFANNINTHEGGTHLSGFRSALTRTVNYYAGKNNLAKDLKESITGDDIREGLTAVISVKIPRPQFEGQTKTKLGNTEVKGIVEAIVNDKLGAFLEENPSVARRIFAKVIDALGCGIGEDFDLAKIRYHRIIIMTDADVDGSHIRTLLLTFFYRQFPDVIGHGYVYIAQPPLFRAKRGKSETYIKDERELDAFLIKRAAEARVVRIPASKAEFAGGGLEELAHKM